MTEETMNTYITERLRQLHSEYGATFAPGQRQVLLVRIDELNRLRVAVGGTTISGHEFDPGDHALIEPDHLCHDCGNALALHACVPGYVREAMAKQS